MQPPSQNPGGAGSELRSDAHQLGSAAANRLHREVDARKDAAVSQAQSVSSAIRRTADGLDEGAPAWLRSAFTQGAEQIQRFADSIENKDSRQLMSEAQRFARNNPGTFLAACAAAGFAAARIFKAGGEQQDSPQFGNFSQTGGRRSEQDQPWGGGEDDLGRSRSSDGQFDEDASNRSRAFIAGESGGQGGSASSRVQQPTGSPPDDNPLVLGTGGEAGRAIGDEGDVR
jgi:hypothetical protein